MIGRLIWALVLAGVISGCAAPQRPKINFPAGTRIGVINHLEDYATHRHFSSLRFDSFSKKISVQWDIPAYMENRLADALKGDSRYTVVSVRPDSASGGDNHGLELIDQISMSPKIKPEVAEFLQTLAQKYQVDIIIVIKSFRGPSAVAIDKHPIELQGYGLFTKAFLISKQAYAYANIAVIVFKTEPLGYIGSGKPRNKKSPLKDFDLAGDLKNLPLSEVNKLKPKIQEYADQAITGALVDANLILEK